MIPTTLSRRASGIARRLGTSEPRRRIRNRTHASPELDRVVPLSYCSSQVWRVSIQVHRQAGTRNHPRIGQGKLIIPKGRTRREAGVQSHGSRISGTTGLPKAEEPRAAWQPAPEGPGAGFGLRRLAQVT